jgi:predicted regulator of Ras-like GTPase activity (Roadblock/LC7/MglB family)
MSRAYGVQAFEANDLRQLDHLLGTFVEQSRVRCALVVDRAGRLLTMAGETAGVDGVAFASLAAADFAASDQLASLLGEEEFSSLYHHGEECSMYLTAVGGPAILAALFDETTTLGMVRLQLRALGPDFSMLFTDLAARGAGKGPALEPNWADEAAEHLDRLFAD